MAAPRQSGDRVLRPSNGTLIAPIDAFLDQADEMRESIRRFEMTAKTVALFGQQKERQAAEWKQQFEQKSKEARSSAALAESLKHRLATVEKQNDMLMRELVQVRSNMAGHRQQLTLLMEQQRVHIRELMSSIEDKNRRLREQAEQESKNRARLEQALQEETRKLAELQAEYDNVQEKRRANARAALRIHESMAPERLALAMVTPQELPHSASGGGVGEHREGAYDQ
jgi:chromosome segregation ATPase